MDGIQAWWHDFFEIVGAIGSAGAAIAAVWLATHERAGRKRAEEERDAAVKAQRTEAREANARSVAVWFSLPIDVAHDPMKTKLVISLANFGTQPIFAESTLLIGYRPGRAVYVRLQNRGAIVGGSTLRNELTVRAGDEWTAATSTYREPDPAREYIYEMKPDAPLSGVRAGLTEITALGCSFRDVQGVRWHRYADGSLYEAEQDPRIAGSGSEADEENPPGGGRLMSWVRGWSLRTFAV